MSARAIGRFDFARNPQIRFGWGRRSELGEVCGEFGATSGLLVIGSRTLVRLGEEKRLCFALRDSGVVVGRPSVVVSGEPTVELIDELTNEIRPDTPDVIVAVGGGAAMDTAKALAATLADPDWSGVREFLEGVGSGKPIDFPTIPVVVLPTTGGTGAEVTKNAVITSYAPPFKKSMRSPQLVPRCAIVDPELSAHASRETTVAAGMDALTQNVESLLSNRSTAISAALAADGASWAWQGLSMFADGTDDRIVRESLALAALQSGLALANSGLGLAHGVAAALGSHCRVPHGLACAVMLPTALEVNRSMLASGWSQLAAAWGLNNDGDPSQPVIDNVRRLSAKLNVPTRLRDLGVERSQLVAIARDSRGNSMTANPVQLSDDRLLAVLTEVF
ncbi:MAG: iron-containing alcohol dehydrogenase [Pirellulaceae bacterium]|jgi:alcohol dehydrogenase class IV|nr:iron-containing alcohol dehydrogenase [Pirellulaceae bacterium]MDP7015961.1 iron-containing alcohol dehydrogenase [Pirellulaceae bacterium]